MKPKALFGSLVFVPLVLCLVPAPAAGQEPVSSLVVTIDGSKEPEKVPEWILWREMFMVAWMLADKSPTRGEEVWVGRAGLTAAQMNGMISRAGAFRTSEAQLDQQVKELRANSSLSPDLLKTRLAEISVEMQRNVLSHRDGLQAAIGGQAIARMLAFARKQIAPTVKVGGMSSAAAGAGGAPVR